MFQNEEAPPAAWMGAQPGTPRAVVVGAIPARRQAVARVSEEPCQGCARHHIVRALCVGSPVYQFRRPLTILGGSVGCGCRWGCGGWLETRQHSHNVVPAPSKQYQGANAQHNGKPSAPIYKSIVFRRKISRPNWLRCCHVVGKRTGIRVSGMKPSVIEISAYHSDRRK